LVLLLVAIVSATSPALRSPAVAHLKIQTYLRRT